MKSPRARSRRRKTRRISRKVSLARRRKPQRTRRTKDSSDKKDKKVKGKDQKEAKSKKSKKEHDDENEKGKKGKDEDRASVAGSLAQEVRNLSAEEDDQAVEKFKLMQKLLVSCQKDYEKMMSGA